MPIREKIVLDTRDYLKKMDGAERAALKYATKQSNAFKKAQRSMGALKDDIQKLKRVRDASNSTASIKKYEKSIKSLQREYDNLEKETKQYGRAVEKAEKKASGGFKRMGKSAKLWLLGAVGGALFVISRVLKDIAQEQIAFDKAITQSLAIQGNVTQNQRNRMEKAARSISKELNISSDKVAEGYFFLASAGLSVEQQIANIDVVARFAKAGMFDLATATDLATDAQSALGLTVENVIKNKQNLIRVTDVLSKANSMSNATIQEFSEALTNRAGSALKVNNKSIEEGVALLAAYADQGRKGQEAGRLMTIFINRLTDAYQRNSAVFDDNSIKLFDAQDNWRNFADIIADMEVTFDGLSDKQRLAKLELLGFTAESKQAITPLLGMSEAIREYQSNAEKAAGKTQEIADKQLKSLSERFGLVKRRIVDAFGEETIDALETFAGWIEFLGEKLDDFRVNLSKELFIDTIFEAPIYFGDKARQDLLAFWKEQEKGAKGARKNVESLGEEFKTVVGKEDEELINNYFNNVKGIIDSFKKGNQNLFTQIQIETDPFELAKLKLSLKVQRETLQEMKEVFEEMEAIKPTGNESAPSSSNLASGVTVESINIITDALKENATAYTDNANELDIWMQTAVKSVALYKQEMTKLKNELDAGIISQEVFAKKSKEANAKYLKSLQEVFKTIKDKLNPEQQKLFQSLFGNFEKAGKDGEDVSSSFDDIADAASGILSVADAFGKVDDNLRNVMRGGIDVLRNLQNIKDLDGSGLLGLGGTGLAGAIPVIGLAGGIASMLSGFFGAGVKKDQTLRK
jgi:TP901 family phage tail tape measure protein